LTEVYVIEKHPDLSITAMQREFRLLRKGLLDSSFEALVRCHDFEELALELWAGSISCPEGTAFQRTIVPRPTVVFPGP